jgi:hypothetical protein
MIEAGHGKYRALRLPNHTFASLAKLPGRTAGFLGQCSQVKIRLSQDDRYAVIVDAYQSPGEHSTPWSIPRCE